MGTEVTSMLVVFIGAVAAAGLASAAIVGVIGDMTVQLRNQGDNLAQAMGTDLAIVNDPQNVPYDDTDNNLTIYVKNTGSATLTPEEASIFVDGAFATFNATLLGDDADSWIHGTVTKFWVDVNLATGDHTVKVVHTPNIADDMDFRL